jgi:hypothetical protein
LGRVRRVSRISKISRFSRVVGLVGLEGLVGLAGLVQCRAPTALQNIEANAAILGDVAVEDPDKREGVNTRMDRS